jgi:transcriptional regulator with XRE-family HTH domain
MSDEKRLRRAAGLTQYELARRAHISKTKIADVECGRGHYNDTQGKRIVRVLVEAIGANVQALTKHDVEAQPEFQEGRGAVCSGAPDLKEDRYAAPEPSES